MNINIFVLIANKAFVNFVPQIKRGMSCADKLFSNDENSMGLPPNTHTQNKNKKVNKENSSWLYTNLNTVSLFLSIKF